MPEPTAKEQEFLDRALLKLRGAIDRSRDPGYNGRITVELGVVDGQLRSCAVGQEETVRR